MTRVAIIGNSGGGKSILSLKLGKAKDLPVYSLDKLQWNAGWIPTPTNVFNKKHNALLATEKWIIDGFASWDTIKTRFEKADTIIFVDHPLWVHYYWAIKRQFITIFKPRPDFPSGCPMLPKTKELFLMMWRIHKELRPRLIKLIEKHKNKGCSVFHIRSPRELRDFINEHAL